MVFFSGLLLIHLQSIWFWNKLSLTWLWDHVWLIFKWCFEFTQILLLGYKVLKSTMFTLGQWAEFVRIFQFRWHSHEATSIILKFINFSNICILWWLKNCSSFRASLATIHKHIPSRINLSLILTFTISKLMDFEERLRSSTFQRIWHVHFLYNKYQFYYISKIVLKGNSNHL